MQNYSRSRQIPIDQLEFKFHVKNEKPKIQPVRLKPYRSTWINFDPQVNKSLKEKFEQLKGEAAVI